jgi:gliding motility-associated lipoprotein GldH
MKKIILFSGIILLLASMESCRKREAVFYHPFTDQSWHRFDKLLFTIPVTEVNQPVNLWFFARHTKEYEFDNLDFSMIMNTPSGEERINQYHFSIKNSYGDFTGNCSGDSCEAVIALKRGIVFSEKGNLKIELENLVPRLETKHLLGVGIKVVPAR